DYGDSGCDSVGGYEPFTNTPSNATTLHPNHPTKLEPSSSAMMQQQSQEQYQGNNKIHHAVTASYDFDRNMTLSSTTYDNGPVIVSMAQVQKVDLEGLCAAKPFVTAHLSLNSMTSPHIASEDGDDEDEERERQQHHMQDRQSFHPMHTNSISMVVAVESPYFIA
ncbi:hypothetical protein BGZ83_007295, partial [Gryganskiella cystojenkinii]